MQRHGLAQILAEGVRIFRANRRRLRRGIDIGDAIAGRRGGIDEPLHAGRPRRLERPQRAHDIGAQVALGVLDRGHDIRKSREVEDPARPRELRGHARAVADVCRDHLELAGAAMVGEVVGTARAEDELAAVTDVTEKTDAIC